jgi:outer membrane receptor protein involved in Fe transport
MILGKRITRRLGFSLGWRWQDEFNYSGEFASGKVQSFSVFDALVKYRIETINLDLEIGGTNIFNNSYSDYLGGGTIGSLYYFSISTSRPFDLF